MGFIETYSKAETLTDIIMCFVAKVLGALLRNDMYSIYRKYRDADEVPVEVQEEMHSLGEAYHNLGFNATGTKIHDEIMAKPTKV